ncbi:MAG: DUF6089 family protein [Bacteroidales bacterium]|nr:DUF6089 family protein [Bacteroidales bacterium]
MRQLLAALLVALVCLTKSFSGNAQVVEVGLSGGACYYLGELNPGKQFLNTDFSAGLYARYNLTTRFAVRLSGNYGRLHADDISSHSLESRSGWFKSDIIDASALCEVNFLPFFIGARNNFWTTYLVGGVSCAFPVFCQGGFLEDEYLFNSQGLHGSDGTEIQKHNTVAPGIAFGFGVKYSFSYNWGIHLEWMMHRTFVDWLDGMYYYGDEEQFRDKEMLFVCDTAHPDWYSMLQVGFSYCFNVAKSKRCKEHLKGY